MAARRRAAAVRLRQFASQAAYRRAKTRRSSIHRVCEPGAAASRRKTQRAHGSCLRAFRRTRPHAPPAGNRWRQASLARRARRCPQLPRTSPCSAARASAPDGTCAPSAARHAARCTHEGRTALSAEAAAATDWPRTPRRRVGRRAAAHPACAAWPNDAVRSLAVPLLAAAPAPRRRAARARPRRAPARAPARVQPPWGALTAQEARALFADSWRAPINFAALLRRDLAAARDSEHAAALSKLSTVGQGIKRGQGRYASTSLNA